MDIVGTGTLKDQILEKVNKMSLESKVYLHGHKSKDEVNKYYQKADLVVVPSRTELFGTVILEAMSHGKLVVASNVGGTPEIINDGLNGILFKKGDAIDLSNKIMEIIDSPEKINFYGKQARKTIEKKYNWDGIIKDIYDTYEEVISNYRG
ncbi:D-inositol 3-phosphate glycosyltransferase [Clostridium sp. C105KSO15]|nr:D-inositol 3-phosphate glycosyltransferase [Clostridium sp. C105KSO15]